MSTELGDLVLTHTRDVPDFPKPGVLFKDVTPLFAAPEAFGRVVTDLADRYRGAVDLVCGIEARGFIIAPPVALALGVGFIPVRKAGKLPGVTLDETYDLEYGTATIEVHHDVIPAGARVLLLDDVLATGGTAQAATTLLRRAGAEVVAFETLLELSFLDGRSALTDVPVRAMATV